MRHPATLGRIRPPAGSALHRAAGRPQGTTGGADQEAAGALALEVEVLELPELLDAELLEPEPLESLEPDVLPAVDEEEPDDEEPDELDPDPERLSVR